MPGDDDGDPLLTAWRAEMPFTATGIRDWLQRSPMNGADVHAQRVQPIETRRQISKLQQDVHELSIELAQLRTELADVRSRAVTADDIDRLQDAIGEIIGGLAREVDILRAESRQAARALRGQAQALMPREMPRPLLCARLRRTLASIIAAHSGRFGRNGRPRR
jgi:hypothetical protein